MLSRFARTWMSRSGSLVSATTRGRVVVKSSGGKATPGTTRHVRRLDAAIGEIDAGRRLRGARHPDQDHVGIVEPPHRLTIVVIEGEGHGVDALEILGVEEMLLAREAAALAPEKGAERADHRIEHRDRRRLQLATALDQRPAQISFTRV